MSGTAVRGWAAAALLAAAVLLVFGAAGSFGFVDYDDGDYVFRNPHLRAGGPADRVRWAFTTFHAANWHPVTWLSFMADDALFGLDPRWCHRENIALHALNAALALALLARLTGSLGGSALVAALFALHPLRAESVAWVTERKGLLMALFALLALHAYVSHARRPGPGRLLLVAALVAASLLAKPQAVVLPLVLLLLDWWPLGRFGGPGGRPAGPGWRVAGEKVPLLFLAAAATGLALLAQRSGGALIPLEFVTPAERLWNTVFAPAAYLAKTAWPAGLSPVYPFGRHPPAQIAVSAALLAAITVLAFWRPRAWPGAAAGWAAFLVLLLPVSSVVQVGGQGMADRYTYLPHLPLFAAAVWAGGGVLRGRARAGAVPCLVLAAVALGAAARLQTALWRDDAVLFTHATAVTEGNWKSHFNLANTLERRGLDAESERHYRLALEARPDYPEALNNLGALLGRRGDGGRAETLFDHAVRVRPGYGPGWFNLGYQRELSGNLAGALDAYRRAALVQSGSPEPLLGEGRVLLLLGRREEAAAACGAALRIAPGRAEAAQCLQDALAASPEGGR